jgi:hypothetical protein
MKWLWIILLGVVGIIAAVFAFEYLTVGIGHLPSWVPGHIAHKRGHLHKRGVIAAGIAVVAFAGAGILLYKKVQDDKNAAAAVAAGQG